MIKAESIRNAILGAANPKEQEIIRSVVAEGKNLLFSEKVHKPVFDEIFGGDDIGRNLGDEIAHTMIVLFDKSRGAEPEQPGVVNQASQRPPAGLPKGALAPAGTVLLADVAEWAGENGLSQIDDATINTALQAMYVKIYDKFESGFRDRVNSGRTQPQTQPPNPAAQPPSQAAQPQGLINAQAGV